MANTIESPKFARIMGAVGTGKSQCLIERVIDLTAAGVKPGSITVVCATPLAARAFSARLANAYPNRAGDIAVETAIDIALEVLADRESVRLTGREPRLLTASEEAFLLEDLKVSGLRPHRLREMLKFFYRSWTELADDDPDWLLPGDEADVHALLKANLSFVRATVEPEAANLAFRCVRALDNLREAHAREHILVDDYQCLSRASQMLVGALATRSLTVAGDPNACVKAYDSYPYAEGLAEFMKTHPDADDEQLTVCRRVQAAGYAARNLLADNPADALDLTWNASTGSGEMMVLEEASPAAEFKRIAHTVAQAMREGELPSRIAVAVPNATWARNISAALRAAGVPTRTLPDFQPARGDIRDKKKCIPARVLTALYLTANPHDAAAWRSWCGYGDYLVNSAAITNLRSFGDKHGLGMVEALEAIADTAGLQDCITGGRRIAEAYQSGRAIIDQVQGLVGRTLLDRLTLLVTGNAESTAPGVLANLCLGSGTDDAATMVQRAARCMVAPVLPDKEAVAVVPYDLMTGLSPNLLVISGFVNGFIPCRDYFDLTVTPLDKQKRMHAQDVRRVYSLVGKAERTLAVTYFTAIDLESAEKLKLKINRIRLEHGRRICSIAPSEFLAQVAAG